MVSRESIFEDTLGIIKRRRKIVKELGEARKAYRKFKRAKEHREAELRIEIARMTSQETEETFGIAKMTDAKTKSVIKEDQKYTNKETGEDKKNDEIFELEQELIMISDGLLLHHSFHQRFQIQYSSNIFSFLYPCCHLFIFF